MSHVQVVYVPIGVPTFHLESAQKEFEDSVRLLSSITEEAVCPEHMLLSVDELSEFLDTVNPDLILLQNSTFANSAYACEVLRRFTCPILLWTLREPEADGGRLKLNSLTGAYSAGNVIRSFGERHFEYVFGSPGEDKVREKISAVIRAASLKAALRELHMASVGHTPQGFGFGRAMDSDLLKVFGVRLESIEARELIDRAREYGEEEWEAPIREMEEQTVGLCGIPAQNGQNAARLYRAYREYVTEHRIGALSSRCWPDFFTAYKTPVCAVLSMLNDMGVAASCEADTYGALPMYMGMYLTGRAVFFGDPVALNEEESTITFWHCGMAPCSLADPSAGAQIGVHPNRKIGPVMDFGCRSWKDVTVFRVGRKGDGSFRFFLLGGEALDKPKQYQGTSVVVRTEKPSRTVVEKSVTDGWEPHFAVIYGDVRKELEYLGHMLGIEVCPY